MVPSVRLYWWTEKTLLPLELKYETIWLRVQKGSPERGGEGWLSFTNCP